MPNNPHDTLFRFTFGRPENAAGLLRSCLPPELTARIDWRSLSLTNASYVDASATWRHSDLVFTALIDGTEAFIFMLVEHQSSVDALMPLRMLGYVSRVWEAFVRDNPKAQRIPAILPVVVSCGEATWKAPTRLLDLLDLGADAKTAFAPYLPNLCFVLDDLTAQGEHRIRSRSLSVAGMLTALSLLGFPRSDAMDVLRGLAELVAALPATQLGSDTLSAVVCYLLEVADPEPDSEQLRSFLEVNVNKTAAEVAMSAAEKLREQGREQGRAEGFLAGRAAVLLHQLTQKFGTPSPAVRGRLSTASVAELDAFVERILSAKSPSDVFEPVPGRARTPRHARTVKKTRKKGR